jgi:hypothetical protein
MGDDMQRCVRVFILSVVLLGATLNYQAQSPRHLFIWAGQSNMVGTGSVAQPHSGPDPRVWELLDSWVQASEPIQGLGVSPALAFANRLLEFRPDWEIGLLPCAENASHIDQWARGEAFYELCLSKVSDGNLVGLIWWQGESDADNSDHANTWGSKFAAMVEGLRQDTGVDFSVVFAQIGPDDHVANFDYWSTVQDQQTLDLPGAVMVKTDDLTAPVYRGTPMHFSTLGYEIIGRRFAEAYVGVNSLYLPLVSK